jgi:general stress protein 26
MPSSVSDQPTPEQLVQQALAVIRADRLPYLATVEGDQPRLRPITPVKVDDFTVYVANLRSYGKTLEIETNPRVELCYLDGHHDQVRITGLAEVVNDPALKQEIWANNQHLFKYVASVDNPDFILYRIVPTRVRFMKEWALTYREVLFQRDLKKNDADSPPPADDNPAGT